MTSMQWTAQLLTINKGKEATVSQNEPGKHYLPTWTSVITPRDFDLFQMCWVINEANMEARRMLNFSYLY
jgi:hypothetical protein